MSLALAHKRRVLAEGPVANSAGADVSVYFADTALSSPANGKKHLKLMVAAMAQDLERISAIDNHGLRRQLKHDELLPKYLDYVQLYRDSGLNFPNSVVMQVLVWLFDTEQFDAGLDLANFAMEQDQQLPERFKRNVPTFVADRLTQKQLFDRLSLATAPWQLLADKSEWPAVFARLGELAIVKRRVGGYDGRGQWRLRENEIDQLPADNYGECIVEQGINFSGEVSLVGARAHDGSTVFYPLTRNLHQDGILRASVAFPQANARQQEQAESMLTAIMNELNYVGVMAMECFVTAEGLLINELAPRVHNSGHWTQNGASISQFELHLRAITGLPLPPPVVNSPSVMINLIGTDLNYDWLKLPLVHLHWYDKEVRPGRKVGHLNLTDSDTDRLSATLEAIKPLLPPEYTSGLFWAQSQLS